jgi:hypothetical protein
MVQDPSENACKKILGAAAGATARFLFLVLLAMLVTALQASASVERAGNREPPARREPASAQPRPGDHLRLRGRLLCDLGSRNTGQPCQLMLALSGQDQRYRLASEAPAMRLYFDGYREVVLEGVFLGHDTLELTRAEHP